jgi:hypothetical protein
MSRIKQIKHGDPESQILVFAVARRASILSNAAMSFRAEPKAQARIRFFFLATISSIAIPERIADITIMFVIDQLFALISGRESGSGPLSVLPGPPREPIGHTDVKNLVIPIRDDVDPEVVITWHGQ